MVKWLITSESYQDENIFYDRFVHLPERYYRQINFSKHILNMNDRGKTNSINLAANNSRSGNSEDAFVLLSIILKDHRNFETLDNEPLDLETLLPDKTCRDKFTQWYQRTATQKVALLIIYP